MLDCKLCPINKAECEGHCIFAEIFDKISLGFVGVDMQRKVVFFLNTKAEEIFEGQLDPNNFDALQEALLKHVTPCSDIAPGHPAIQDKIRLGNKIIGYTAYCFSGGHYWINLADITAQERLASIAEAVNTMNNIGYIFSGIRHELGNPLNSLKMTMHVLKKNIDKYDHQTIVDYVDRALGEIDRAEYLLKALKSFSMYERLDLGPIDMPSFLEQLLKVVKTDFAKQGVHITSDVRTGGERCYADARALQQVLINLLTNSLDALARVPAPKIEIEIGGAEEHIVMVLRDNGAGMSREQLENAFKPFYTTKEEGSGLGLAIVRKTLAKMQGTIDMSSIEGVGTAVTITLPRMAATHV